MGYLYLGLVAVFGAALQFLIVTPSAPGFILAAGTGSAIVTLIVGKAGASPPTPKG